MGTVKVTESWPEESAADNYTDGTTELFVDDGQPVWTDPLAEWCPVSERMADALERIAAALEALAFPG